VIESFEIMSSTSISTPDMDNLIFVTDRVIACIIKLEMEDKI
jgi:hypothetical protein